jgi:hypothetical protein
MTIKSFLQALLIASIMSLALLAPTVSAIYPSDHFQYSTKLTQANYVSKIQSEIDLGKTVFVRWIASEG